MSSIKKQPAPATTYSSKPVMAIARVLRMRLSGRKKWRFKLYQAIESMIRKFHKSTAKLAKIV